MSRHRSVEIDVANCFILSLEGSIDDSKVGKVEKRSVRYLDDYFANDGRAIRVNIFYRVVRLSSPPTRGCAPLFCREPRTARDVSSSRSFPIFAKIRESEGNESMENAG